MQARGEFKILRESAASAHVDGGGAIGAVTATRALALACAKAAAVGVGVVTTVNSTDIGRLGSYLLKPAQAGFVTLLLVNDSGGLPTVAPFGGAARFFSTNPLGAGIPRRDAEPIIIDLATSMASVGKLRMAAQRGASVPAGWLIDAQGATVTDPARFFAEPDAVFLLPLGGLLAGYKGFALQLLVDVLVGAVGGAGVATGVDPGIEANALFALALAPDYFGGQASFLDLVEQMVAGLESTPSLPNREGVRIPGQRAAQERQQRLATGIVLNGALQEELATLLAELGLAESYQDLLKLHPDK
jgi:L-2-hydroxycarboxylate dehydrogenase (NAD+)